MEQLSASNRHDCSQQASAQEHEGGGFGGSGSCGLRRDREGELKRWSEGLGEVDSSLKQIGSWNEGDVEGSEVLRDGIVGGHFIPVEGSGAIQKRNAYCRGGIKGRAGACGTISKY